MMLKKFLQKVFTPEPTLEKLDARRKKRHEIISEWRKKPIVDKQRAANLREETYDLRRSHLCAGCHKKSTWMGALCDGCQDKFDLWCPCDVEHHYTARDFKTKLESTKRVPLPDWLVSEHCNRCGYRIKPIWDLMMDEVTDDKILDEKISALIDDYEKRAAAAEMDFRQNADFS
jgi:hypothetical protein